MNSEFLSGLFRDIILREGELILPFMGSILLEDVPASFSEDGMVVTPPSKKLVFNNYNLSSNDILLNEYAKRREISRFAAKQALYKELEELRTQAEKEGVLTLEGFGTFRFTNRDGYTVDPAPGFVISTDTFGLTAIDLNEQPVAESEQQPVAESEQRPVAEPEPQPAAEEPVAEPVAETVAAVEQAVAEEKAETKEEPAAQEPTAEEPTAEEQVAESVAEQVAEETAAEEVTETPAEEIMEEEEVQTVDLVAEEPAEEPAVEKVAEVSVSESIAEEEKETIGKKEEPAAEKTAKKKKSSAYKALITILVIVAVLLVAAALIYIFRDSLRPILEEILYSDEEIKIIHYKL
ncbi:MAG: hypothetical protein IKS79_00990 [Bacteroidales bacterium]|nr:hypothetical protein [Bacteroidales bacterium]